MLSDIAHALDAFHTVVLASVDRASAPHAIPLWFVTDQQRVWMSTGARSTKARNLRRMNRAALLASSGERFVELRGVLVRGSVVVHDDPATVEATAQRIAERYIRLGLLTPETGAGLVSQTPVRVALEFTPEVLSSWPE